jgi:transglutaminase-like putative cysteine protease
MSPGSISDLAESDEIAFRVKFFGATPSQSQLYWRALVLDNYDGRTWTHSQHIFPHITRVEIVESKEFKYQVTLEPTGQNWLFAIDLPRTVQSRPDNQATINPDMQIRTANPVNTRLRYDVTSYPNYKFQADVTPAELRGWLQLPPDYNPQTQAFAKKLRSLSDNDGVLINTVLNFYRKQAFRYTLQPPLLGDNAVDEFLFTTQAGFCEHYAGSFVFLMRAMGIPARVVMGYLGGEMNPVDGYMEIRQSDAHAWAEVWLPQRGWVRIDPTAAVAPERVEKNLNSVIPRTALGGLIKLSIGKDSWLSKWRFNTAAISNAWNQWVLNYSPERQRNFIQSLGFENADWQTMITLMAVFGVAVVGLISVPLVMKRQKVDPLQALYILLCQQLARSGYAREKHEGPRDYRLRVTATNSTLSPTRKLAVGRFLQHYELLRYTALEPQKAKRGLSQLKSLLSECK